MASVNTNAIEGYVVDELKRRGLNGVWFGGNDIEEEDVWKWTDRTPWEFTNWGPYSPNNEYGDQDCLQYDDIEWKWDDDFCIFNKTFVCSKNIC